MLSLFAIVVPEVEPSVLPAPVRGRHRTSNVEVGARLPHLERATFDPHGLPDAPFVLGRYVRLEQVELETLVGQSPQIPLAHGDEDCRLHDGVGVKSVELHPVVVR